VAMLSPDMTEGHRARQPIGTWGKLAVEGAREGHRNDSIAKLAGFLFNPRNALLKDEPDLILEFIQWWNTTHVHPPLHPEEVRTIVSSIAGKAAKKLQRRSTAR
jgi:hypothetical protein